jgi:HK97 family phage major capsid protein
MNKLEILNEIKTRNLSIAEIMDTIKAEERELSNVEKINVESYKAEIAEFERQLKDLDKEPVKLKRSIKIGSAVEDKKFSLNRYLRSIADPTFELNEIEKEVRNSIKSEFGVKGVGLPFEFRSTLAAGTAGAGQEIVPEDKFNLIMPLRAKSVLAKAGATIYTGVKGNVSFPVMTGSTAAWKGENVTASDGTNGFTEVEFSPKRLTVYLAVSKLLLLQDTVDAEAKLQADLVNAINQKLEATILGADAGSTTQPAGLFYGASYSNGGVTVTGSTSWAKVVALETGINSSNADVDSMYYIVHLIHWVK